MARGLSIIQRYPENATRTVTTLEAVLPTLCHHAEVTAMIVPFLWWSTRKQRRRAMPWQRIWRAQRKGPLPPVTAPSLSDLLSHTTFSVLASASFILTVLLFG